MSDEQVIKWINKRLSHVVPNYKERLTKLIFVVWYIDIRIIIPTKIWDEQSPDDMRRLKRHIIRAAREVIRKRATEIE